MRPLDLNHRPTSDRDIDEPESTVDELTGQLFELAIRHADAWVDAKARVHRTARWRRQQRGASVERPEPTGKAPDDVWYTAALLEDVLRDLRLGADEIDVALALVGAPSERPCPTEERRERVRARLGAAVRRALGDADDDVGDGDLADGDSHDSGDSGDDLRLAA